MAFASRSARAAAAAPLLVAAACADVAWVDVHIPATESCEGDLARVNLLEPVLFELPDGASCDDCYDGTGGCPRVEDIPCRCGARIAINGGDLQAILSGLSVRGLTGADHCLQVKAWDVGLIPRPGDCDCISGALRACAVGAIPADGNSDINLDLLCPGGGSFDTSCGVD